MDQAAVVAVVDRVADVVGKAMRVGMVTHAGMARHVQRLYYDESSSPLASVHHAVNLLPLASF